MVEEITVPDKKYFKIGETSSLLGVKPHVLRYWETEFPQIRPTKSKTGQRLYRRRDVEALIRIQKLLYKERFTIAGARKALRLPVDLDGDVDGEVALVAEMTEIAAAQQIPVNPEVYMALLTAKKELEGLLRLLDG